MDELQGRLRRVLDPLGYGIPRRAVISASSRVVMDKSRAVDETEIGSISEVCSIIFGTEPRHPADLLRRAFTSSSKDSTWQALRDDIVWEYPVTLGLEYVGDVVRVLLAQPDECRAFVCLKLVVGTSPEVWEGLMESFVDIAGQIAAIDSEVVVLAFRETLTFLNVPRQTLYDMVMRYPQTVKFLRYTDIAGVYDCGHAVVEKLIEYARTLPAPQRTGPLVFLAVLTQHSILPRGAAALGLETLVGLKRVKYDVQVAASAAVLAQCEESSVVASLAAVIESLAAALQKSTT